jgi:hypothetical protein
MTAIIEVQTIAAVDTFSEPAKTNWVMKYPYLTKGGVMKGINTIIKTGIINCVTGKKVKEKVLKDDSLYKCESETFQKKVLEEVKKMSEWFDDKDTFYNGRRIWNHWEEIGDAERFKAVIKGTNLNKIAFLSIAVFNGNHGQEHELYVERIDNVQEAL